MESIQLAQMLADLSDLNAAQESRAAVALVNANKTLAPPPTSQPSPHPADPLAATTTATAAGGQRNHQRTGSGPHSILSRTASPAMFDRLGRRLLTPPITRSNSSQGSVPGTPRKDDSHVEDDVDRANSLMALYEIRAKLKQQDSSSLNKVREKIAALHARQQHGDRKEGPAERPSVQSRYSYPQKPS